MIIKLWGPKNKYFLDNTWVDILLVMPWWFDDIEITKIFTYFDKISKIACIYRVFTLGSNIPNEKILMPVYTWWVAPTFNGLTFSIFDLFLKCHHF